MDYPGPGYPEMGYPERRGPVLTRRCLFPNGVPYSHLNIRAARAIATAAQAARVTVFPTGKAA
jgi:hypothetical protein